MAGEDEILRLENGLPTRSTIEDNLHVYTGTGLAVGDAVYISAADTVSLADADGAGVPPVGLVVNVDGSDITVCHPGGIAAGLSGITVGQDYWLSTAGTTGNTLTTTKPDTNAYLIGVGKSTTSMLIACTPADLAGITGSGTSDRIMRWDGTSAAKDSGVTLDNSNDMTGVGNINLSGNVILSTNLAAIAWDDVGAAPRIYAGTGAGGNMNFDSEDDLIFRTDGTEIFRMNNEGYFDMVESASATGRTGYGRWWVRNDATQTPMFTADDGTEFELNTGGSSGVTGGGTTVVGAIPKWDNTSGTAITGNAAGVGNWYIGGTSDGTLSYDGLGTAKIELGSATESISENGSDIQINAAGRINIDSSGTGVATHSYGGRLSISPGGDGSISLDKGSVTGSGRIGIGVTPLASIHIREPTASTEDIEIRLQHQEDVSAYSSIIQEEVGRDMLIRANSELHLQSNNTATDRLSILTNGDVRIPATNQNLQFGLDLAHIFWDGSQLVMERTSASQVLLGTNAVVNAVNGSVILQDGGTALLTANTTDVALTVDLELQDDDQIRFGTSSTLCFITGNDTAGGTLRLENNGPIVLDSTDNTGSGITLDVDASGNIDFNDEGTTIMRMSGSNRSVNIDGDGSVANQAAVMTLRGTDSGTTSSSYIANYVNKSATADSRLLKLAIGGTTNLTSSYFLRCFSNSTGGAGTLEYSIRKDGLAQQAFTGQHPVIYEAAADGVDMLDELQPGHIVEVTGDIWRNNNTETGSPRVKYCTTNGSSKVYGVLSESYEDTYGMSYWDYFSGTFNDVSAYPVYDIAANYIWNGTTTITTTDTSEVEVEDNIRLDSDNQWFNIISIDPNVSITIENPLSKTIPTGSGASASSKAEDCYEERSFSSNSKYFKSQTNSSGDGQIWITNATGDIQAGDLIESSDVIDENGRGGYGQKQSDDIIRSKTVAKVVQDVDWSAEPTTFTPNSGGPGGSLKRIKVACIYLI